MFTGSGLSAYQLVDLGICQEVDKALREVVERSGVLRRVLTSKDEPRRLAPDVHAICVMIVAISADQVGLSILSRRGNRVLHRHGVMLGPVIQEVSGRILARSNSVKNFINRVNGESFSGIEHDGISNFGIKGRFTTFRMDGSSDPTQRPLKDLGQN